MFLEIYFYMSYYDVEYVVFDFDGTLVDNTQSMKEVWRKSFLSEGFVNVVTDDFMNYQRSKPSITAVNGYFEIRGFEGLSESKIKNICAYKKKLLLDGACKDSKLMPNLFETLRGIRRLNLGLGICTSASASEVNYIFNENRKFREYFNLESENSNVFCKDRDYKVSKDKSSEALDLFCERLGVSDVSRVLYVGDGLTDMSFARMAGAHFIGFVNGTSGVNEFPSDVKVVRQLEFILDELN